jgi:hypothetical protein
MKIDKYGRGGCGGYLVDSRAYAMLKAVDFTLEYSM